MKPETLIFSKKNEIKELMKDLEALAIVILTRSNAVIVIPVIIWMVQHIDEHRWSSIERCTPEIQIIEFCSENVANAMARSLISNLRGLSYPRGSPMRRS